MPYNNVTSRADSVSLIPEEVATEIWQGAIEESAVLSSFRNVTMSRKKKRYPVLSALPIAYFTGGDTGLKQTTEVNWTDKYLEAETLAVIVPVPEDVKEDIDNGDFDFTDNVMPLIRQAFGRTIDAAVIFGTNKPSTWGPAIVPQAATASNTVSRGTADPDEGGIAEDINQLMALVEADGYDVDGFIARHNIKSLLRSARDVNGQPLVDVKVTSLYDLPIKYAMKGLWPGTTGTAELIAGDMSAGIVGIRKDISVKVLEEAVIQDETGATIFNFAQQDMIGLKFTMRLAWQVANPINYMQATEANRWPFAALLAP